MTTATVSYSTVLAVIDCGDCGIPFAWPADLDRRARNDGSSFHCPNGHRIRYTETEEQRLRKQVDGLGASLTAARDQLDAEQRSHAATKGQLTKTRKRVANGVCPCCHRSFTNVKRHMTTKHPEFVASPDATEKPDRAGCSA